MSAQSEPSSPGARLSIGEVVALLRPEFSDLTDSKIRFLEDRKLISPARTAGGYRSFGPHDIEVLRWILTRQRDQYLPLSIIGERIDRGEHLADIWGIGVGDAARSPHAGAAADAVPADSAADDSETATPAAVVARSAAADERTADGEAASGGESSETGAAREALPETAARTGERLSGTVTTAGQVPWAAHGDDRTYTAAEISAESGLTLDEIAELTGFGLLVPLDETEAGGSLPLRPSATDNSRPSDDAAPVRSLRPGIEAAPVEAVQASLGLEPPEPRYGGSALLIARISREFATYGLHARHLRVIRNAAARDASMFEQGIQPILHAGGASADLDAQRSLGRLVALCERLRSVVMGEALRRYWR